MSPYKNKYWFPVIVGISINVYSSNNSLAEGVDPRNAIEEVMVSARRSEESIQSTPVTVSAFNAEALREKAISTPEDLQMSTPGVFLSGTASRQNVIYQIRGQSKSIFGPNSPAVVSYFAEVPDPFVGSFVPQYDLNSVQVLKGPQGTLFGRNTTGGAILYSPQAPTYETNGYITGTLGNYDKREIQGAVSFPVIDNKVALRLAGDVDKRDGFTKNIGNNSDIDDTDSRSYRVSLLLDPIENLTNTTIYDYYLSNSGGTAQIIADVHTGNNLLSQLGLQTSALQQLAAQKAWGPYKSNSVVDYDGEKNERNSWINRTEYQWSDIQLVNIFGYRKTKLNLEVNTDGMGTLIADGTGPFPAGTPVNYIKANLHDEVKQTSDELQLRGKLDDGKFDWLVGGFWLKSKPNGAQGSSVAFAQVPGQPVAAPAYNFIEQESKAIFGHFTYDLADWLTGLQLELGVRYTKDKTTSCTANGVNTEAGPLLADATVVDQSDCLHATSNVTSASVNTAKSDVYTWSAGLNWQITDDLFSYLVSRHGYRAGGVNGPSFSGRLAAFQSFDPETVTDVEAGIRSDWTLGDMAVRTNLSAFVGRYDHVQSALTGIQTATALCNPLSANNPAGISPDGDCSAANDPAGGVVIVNLGESQVSGVDFDVTVAVTPELRVNVGGNYLDMRTRSYNLPDAFAPYVATKEISFPLAPEKTFNAGVRYELSSVPFADNVVFNVDYYWTDDFMYTDVTLPSYGLTNLRIDINSLMHSNLDLSFFGRNVFNKEYEASGASAGSFIGITALVYGAPRTVGAELRYRF
ncbi:MAG: TonB-dependent receptor [Verrucomicrobiaceae bacterium]|nr:TonB-dependent receptor [Verrucomicrobiaceae bacterium]